MGIFLHDKDSPNPLGEARANPAPRALLHQTILSMLACNGLLLG